MKTSENAKATEMAEMIQEACMAGAVLATEERIRAVHHFAGQVVASPTPRRREARFWEVEAHRFHIGQEQRAQDADSIADVDPPVPVHVTVFGGRPSYLSLRTHGL